MTRKPSLLLLLIISLAASLLTTGCAYFVSWHDLSESWVGHPIGQFIKLNGDPSSISAQGDGNEEYRFDLKKLDPSCVHWWNVNKEGTIIGYRYAGRCRPIG